MPAGTLNFSPTTPAPPANQQNIVPQNDGGGSVANQSFYDPLMVGDSGAGGKAGNAPAPASGDAAALKFLRADGTWSKPPGSVAATLSAAPSAPGNFSIAHGLSAAPSRIAILMTSDGAVWQQAPPDATNIYLAASDTGVTAQITVFA